MADARPSTALTALAPAVRALVAHVLGASRNDADIDDCTSEVFRRVLEGHERLQPGAPLRPWVLGIARHVALDARQARRLALARSAPDLRDSSDASPLLDGIAEAGPGPYEQTELAERSRRLKSALEALPAEQCQALLLCAEGIGYREIGERLSVPLGTVCTWIARARQGLLRTLKDDVPEKRP
jgi:RNA polymerase sigma factor (sigma-70 family)